MGQTTQQQVKELFGDPWRVGVEDGRPTWTYGRYRYKLFGETQTKDLVVRFDEQNRVHSYTFSTTEPRVDSSAREKEPGPPPARVPAFRAGVALSPAA